MSAAGVRVAIVEDQRDIREGLRFLIDGTPGYACAGAFGAMESALAALSPAVADIVLMDLGLPGMSGLEGIALLKTRHPELRLIALTVYEDTDKIFAALCAGASGYLLKKTPPAKLLESIREAHEGGAPMSPEIARKVITLFQQTSPLEKLDEPLTPQETRLLKLLSEGYSYQNSAGQLNISINTVRNYIRSIYEKLHVNTKSEAVSKALRHRLIQ